MIKKIVPVLIFLVIASCWIPGSEPAFAAKNAIIRRGKVFLNLKDADIKSVLQLFAKATGTNIVASDDVDGKVTVTFTGITPRKGLEAVLKSKGLDWFEEEGTIFVSTKKVLRTYYLNHARPSDIKTLIKNILPSGSSVSDDDTYNALVVQTSSDYLPRLEKLIKELDVPPTQVMIEVKMIEVRHTGGGNIGLDTKYTSPSNANNIAQTTGLAGRSTDSGAQGLYTQVLSGNFEAYLSAVQTAGKVNTIATPRITTLSNKEASILIGQKLGYKTTVTSQTQTTEEINFLEVGTALKLTPYVTKAGFIRMKVAPKISDGEVTNDLPNENTTETQNEVVVKNGQTFVIGGLLKDKETQNDYGVPILMDIPLLGSVFRKTVTTKDKRELLVFVTPYIIGSDAVEKDSATKISEMEQESAKNKARLIH